MGTSGASIAKDIYYTPDHEWLDFQEPIAYTGICRFKLTGFRDIQEIIFPASLPGFIKQGTLLAIVKSKDYQIEAHMPVDGELLQMNEAIRKHTSTLLNDPEKEGWIAKIVPAQPLNRNKLLSAQQYQQKTT